MENIKQTAYKLLGGPPKYQLGCQCKINEPNRIL
jgi:hypothetical protein